MSGVLNIGRLCGCLPAGFEASAERFSAGPFALPPLRTFLLRALGFAFAEVHNAIFLAWILHSSLSEFPEALFVLCVSFDGRDDNQSHEEETEDLRRERSGCWTFV